VLFNQSLAAGHFPAGSEAYLIPIMKKPDSTLYRIAQFPNIVSYRPISKFGGFVHLAKEATYTKLFNDFFRPFVMSIHNRMFTVKL